MADVDIKGAVTRKIGPLPAWAYGGAIAVAAWLYYMWKKRTNTGTNSSAQGSASTGLLGTDAASYTPDVGVVSGFDSAGSGGLSGGVTASGGLTSPTNNAQWFTMASNYLVGFGYDAASVTQALNNYLTGEQASAQDKALYGMAVARFGVPPEGVPLQPGGTGSTPPPIPGGSGGGLAGVSGLTVTVDAGGKGHASWTATPGASWYTYFIRTPHGSTGGYTIQATSADFDVIPLAVQHGEYVEFMVFAHADKDYTSSTRGPDTTVRTTRP